MLKQSFQEAKSNIQESISWSEVPSSSGTASMSTSPGDLPRATKAAIFRLTIGHDTHQHRISTGPQCNREMMDAVSNLCRGAPGHPSIPFSGHWQISKNNERVESPPYNSISSYLNQRFIQKTSLQLLQWNNKMFIFFSNSKYILSFIIHKRFKLFKWILTKIIKLREILPSSKSYSKQHHF